MAGVYYCSMEFGKDALVQEHWEALPWILLLTMIEMADGCCMLVSCFVYCNSKLVCLQN